MLAEPVLAAHERPQKRPKVEADRRRENLEKVSDKYADIDFTRFQKVEDNADDAGGAGAEGAGATSTRFVTMRPGAAALVKDWRLEAVLRPWLAADALRSV